MNVLMSKLLNQSLDSVNESLLNELVESIGCRVGCARIQVLYFIANIFGFFFIFSPV